MLLRFTDLYCVHVFKNTLMCKIKKTFSPWNLITIYLNFTDILPPIYPPKTLPPTYPPQPYAPPYPKGVYDPLPIQSYDPPPTFKKPHQGPKQNCTVKDEILRAEICTPSFETLCEEESMTIKKITTKEYCFDLATTECTETEETIEVVNFCECK